MTLVRRRLRGGWGRSTPGLLKNNMFFVVVKCPDLRYRFVRKWMSELQAPLIFGELWRLFLLKRELLWDGRNVLHLCNNTLSSNSLSWSLNVEHARWVLICGENRGNAAVMGCSEIRNKDSRDSPEAISQDVDAMRRCYSKRCECSGRGGMYVCMSLVFLGYGEAVNKRISPAV